MVIPLVIIVLKEEVSVMRVSVNVSKNVMECSDGYKGLYQDIKRQFAIAYDISIMNE